MHLTLATVATLVTGLTLLGVVFFKEMGVKDRLGAGVAGLAFTAYALWGITRSSGTFLYGWYTFVVPAVIIGGLVVKTLKGRSSATTGTAPASPDAVAVPPVLPQAEAGVGSGRFPEAVASHLDGAESHTEASGSTVRRDALRAQGEPASVAWLPSGGRCGACGHVLGRSGLASCPRCGAPVQAPRI